MRYGKRIVLAGLVAAAMVATLPLAASARPSDDVAKAKGACTVAANWKLTVRQADRDEGNGFRATLRVKGAPVGSMWSVVMNDNGKEFFNDVRTASANGRFRAIGTSHDRQGRDDGGHVVMATATDQVIGEVCDAHVEFEGH
jgi:hypothetical protein